jgi:hypothetical protein
VSDETSRSQAGKENLSEHIKKKKKKKRWRWERDLRVSGK